MQLDPIRLAIRRDPFVPFTLKLKTGKTLRVDKLGYLGVGWDFIVKTSPKHNRARFVPAVDIEALEHKDTPINNRKSKK
ncbi:MAG TPA: hypothetical protein PLN21_15120 [Gemmatales bacterium]|nr:hypothetical protein [Gemmatales bacterium]